MSVWRVRRLVRAPLPTLPHRVYVACRRTCSMAQPDPMSTPAGTPVAGGVARSNVAPRLPYDDLRQWLEEARRLGEVKEVSGLNCEQEIGLVAGVAMHDDAAPCFVFDRVPATI